MAVRARLVAALLCCLLMQMVQAQPPSVQRSLTSICPQIVDSTLLKTSSCKTKVIQHNSAVPISIAFKVPKNADFGVVFQLQSASGNVDMAVTTPVGNVSRSNQVVGADIVGYSALQMSQAPGDWTITITNAVINSSWTLAVITSRPKVRLNAANKAALGSLAGCCADFTESFPACQSLVLWTGTPLQGKADLENDLCQDPDNECDADGNVLRLTLPGISTSLASTPAAFPKCPTPPASLVQLQKLQYLDLRDNGISWSFGQLAAVLGKMSSLTHVNLDRNFMTGGLTCEVFEAPSKLQVLSVSNDVVITSNGADPVFIGANRLSGKIPDCVFQSLTLKALDLKANTLQGPLPPIPRTSGLLYLNLAWQGGLDDHSTLNGPMPLDVVNAFGLQHLDLSRNGLNGQMPVMPANLVYLDLAVNALTGPIPQEIFTLKSLRVLNLANNMLQGTISSALGQMTSLEKLWLTDNLINGTINFDWNNENLQVLRISGTQISGPVPAAFATLPNLYTISLTRNPGLTSQADFAAALPSINNIVWYNVSGCSIKDLPDGLAQLGVFTSVVKYYDPDMLTDSHCFDVSDNNIQATLPTWMLGPFPNSDEGVEVEYVGFQGPLTEDRNRITCPLTGVTATMAESGMRVFEGQPTASCVPPYNKTSLVPMVTALATLKDNKNLDTAQSVASPPSPKVKVKTTDAGKMQVGALTLEQLSAILGGAVSLLIIAAVSWYIVKYCKKRKTIEENAADYKGAGGHPVIHVAPTHDAEPVQVRVVEPTSPDPVAPPSKRASSQEEV